jgi:hypothetical protein
MGNFHTEFELYTKGLMKKAFIHARLLDNLSEEALLQSVKELTKTYLTKQLFHYLVHILWTEKLWKPNGYSKSILS